MPAGGADGHRVKFKNELSFITVKSTGKPSRKQESAETGPPMFHGDANAPSARLEVVLK